VTQSIEWETVVGVRIGKKGGGQKMQGLVTKGKEFKSISGLGDSMNT
jgi:hypothetical protein